MIIGEWNPRAGSGFSFHVFYFLLCFSGLRVGLLPLSLSLSFFSFYNFFFGVIFILFLTLELE